MDPKLLKSIASYAAVIAVGAGAGYGIRHYTSSSSTAPGASPTTDQVQTAEQSFTRNEIFQETWRQLMDSELKGSSRQKPAFSLLSQWYRVSPKDAIQNAIDGNRIEGIELADGYLMAFDTIIAEQPDTLFELITSRAFGLDTAPFRTRWLKSLAKKNPEILEGYLGRFDPKIKQQAITLCIEAYGKNPEHSGRLIEQLATLPDTPENRNLWKLIGRAPSQRDIPALKSEFLAAQTPGSREIAKAGLSNALGQKFQEEIRATLQDLSPELRKEMAISLINTKKTRAEATLTAAEVLIALGDWETLRTLAARRLSEQIQYYPEPEKLVDWGLTLPERAETEELYRVSLRAYLTKKSADAKKWILEMPPGWHRDIALLEYAQTIAGKRPADPREIEWAVGLIQGERPKTAATAIRDKLQPQPAK